MRFSVWPSPSQSSSDVMEVSRHADATGWDGVYISDHFMGDGGAFGPMDAPVLESTALLAALSSATECVRLGSLVFGTTYRHPAVLANWAATLDHLSDGRLVLGLGAGWQLNEHDQYGIELPAVGPRVSRFAETCEVITGLLGNTTTNFDGDWFTLRDAHCEPKPVQDPLPILIGAKGQRMIGIAARFAHEWNAWGLPQTLTEPMELLDRECEAHDRDPSTVARSTQALVMLTDNAERAREFVDSVAPRAAIAGTPDQIADVVTRYAETGIDELIVPDFVLGTGARRLESLDALLEAFRPFR